MHESPPGARGRPQWAAGMVVLLCALAMIVIRVGVGSVQELSAAQASLEAGEETEALRRFEAAAHWYLPGSPMVAEAFEGMWGIAEARMARGDRQGALAAYSAVRGSVLATRGLTTPNGQWLARADAAIIELWLSEPDATWPSPQLSEPGRRAQALAALAAPAEPAPLWSAVAVLAFVGWIGGAVGFIMRGFDATGALQRPAALKWAGVIVTAFTLWLIGMGQA